jgi:hypothetical protein
MHRTFLLLFRDLPIDSTGVRRGENPPAVVTAVRAVNVALFLSNDLRRDVTVCFGINAQSEWKIISFPGLTLRRVSPDERSISFFLLKAMERLDDMLSDSHYIMDNGIELSKTQLDDFISKNNPKVYLSSGNNNSTDLLDYTADSLLIYQIDTAYAFEDVDYLCIPKPRTPERFILDINRAFDSRE